MAPSQLPVRPQIFQRPMCYDSGHEWLPANSDVHMKSHRHAQLGQHPLRDDGGLSSRTGSSEEQPLRHDDSVENAAPSQLEVLKNNAAPSQLGTQEVGRPGKPQNASVYIVVDGIIDGSQPTPRASPDFPKTHVLRFVRVLKTAL